MWELLWVYNLNKHCQVNPSFSFALHCEKFWLLSSCSLTLSLGYPSQQRLRQRVTFLAQTFSPLGQVMFISMTSEKIRKRT